MLDLDDIKRVHNNDDLVVGDVFLTRNNAILKLRAAHRHRGLLLAEVERLKLIEAQRDESTLAMLALLDDFKQAERERNEALAKAERLKLVEAQRDEYIRQLEQESDEARAEIADLKARLISMAEIV